MIHNNHTFLLDNPEHNGDDADGALDLKAIRESKGLTLKDIFKMTRISVVNLEAIENNDLHLLPAPVYTKTFIKTYAKALGVDSKNILERYAKHLRSLSASLPEEQAEKPARKIIIPPRALIWSIAVLIFCSLIFLSLALHDKTEMEVRAPARPKQEIKTPDAAIQPDNTSLKLQPAESSPAASKPSTVPIVTQKAAVSPAVPQQTGPGAGTVKAPVPTPAAVSRDQSGQKAAASGAQYRLRITAKELTWLKIVSDQNPPYEILLQPGEKLDRSTAEFFQLDIGNAGGIDAEFQGKPLGNLGKSGEVVHLKLP